MGAGRVGDARAPRPPARATALVGSVLRASDRSYGCSPRIPETKARGSCAIGARSRRAAKGTAGAGRHPRVARRRRLRLRHDRAARGDGARRGARSPGLFPRHGAFGGGFVRAHQRGAGRRGRWRRGRRRPAFRRGSGRVRQLRATDAISPGGQAGSLADGRSATRSPPENSIRPASSSSISATRTSRAEASAARARSSSVIGEGPSRATMRSRAASRRSTAT